jgi:hypothetical protein
MRKRRGGPKAPKSPWFWNLDLPVGAGGRDQRDDGADECCETHLHGESSLPKKSVDPKRARLDLPVGAGGRDQRDDGADECCETHPHCEPPLFTSTTYLELLLRGLSANAY